MAASAADRPPPHRLRTVIWGHGTDAEGRPACLEVHGSGPAVRLGLPAHIDWSDPWNLRRLWELVLAAGCRHFPIPTPSRPNPRPAEHAPLSPECLYHCWVPVVPGAYAARATAAEWVPALEWRRPLYYARVQWDPSAQKYAPRPLPFVTVRFHHQAAKAHFLRHVVAAGPLVEHRLGPIQLTLWEDHRALGAVDKMLVERGLATVGWVQYRPSGSAPEQATRCHASTLEPVPGAETLGRPSVQVMSFDIECNSSVEGAFPDAANPNDVVFQIGCVLSSVAAGTDRRQFRRVILSLGQPDPAHPLLVARRVQVRAFATEYALLLGFRDLVREWRPDVMVGYNVFGFDWKYLVTRADKHWRCLAEFLAFGRRGGGGGGWVPGRVDDRGANSKFQSATSVEADGIVMMDLLPYIRSGYKLANYRLKTVGEQFLAAAEPDMAKDPLSPQDIFRLFAESAPTGMAQVAAYCVQDAEMVSLLFAKLHVWYGLCESASVNNVPIPFLYTRGEQIRMFMSVYRYAHSHAICVNMPVPDRDRDHKPQRNKAAKFKGAEVLPPVRGQHQRVLTFDFSSMYPSIIQAHNLDFTTLVRPDGGEAPTLDVDPSSSSSAGSNSDLERAHRPRDEHCHVFGWTDHVAGCRCAGQEVGMGVAPKKPTTAKRPRGRGSMDQWLVPPPLAPLPLPSYEAETKTAEVEAEADADAPRCVVHRYTFLREEFCAAGAGVVPTLLRTLLDARASTRVLEEACRQRVSLAEAEGRSPDPEDAARLGVYEKRQLAYKVSANSMYGAMGAPKGYLPLRPAAMCIPLVGRQSIRKVVAFMESAENGGKVVYGDTDSAFVAFPSLAEEVVARPGALREMGVALGRRASAMFPAPMKLEFERSFERLLLLSKKRYIGLPAGKKALYYKGVVKNRRDSCPVVHRFYEAAAMSIFGLGLGLGSAEDGGEQLRASGIGGGSGSGSGSGGGYADAMSALAESVRRLLARGGFPLEDYVLTKELTQNPGEYATMPAHAGVALRMESERGQKVPKKTRMELVLVRRPVPGVAPLAEDPGAKQEDRLEDLDYFRQHRWALELDVFQYWESQLANPLDELLHRAFPDQGRRKASPMLSWLAERRVFAECMQQIRTCLQPGRAVFVAPHRQTALTAHAGFGGLTTHQSQKRRKTVGRGGLLRRPLMQWGSW
jgi:DNA polymerase elongation subunit (family B)